MSLLSLLLEVLHEEVESEVAENRYFVTETILTPGIQPLGSYDLVDDHQLFCLVSHVTLKHGKIVNQINILNTILDNFALLIKLSTD